MSQVGLVKLTDKDKRPPRAAARSRLRPRWIVLIVVVTLVAALAALALAPTTRWVRGDGYVTTDLEAELRPSVEGVVARVLRRTGDQLAEGDPVVQLVDAVERAAVLEARSELAVQQADLARMRAAHALGAQQRAEQLKQAEYRRELIDQELKVILNSDSFSKLEIDRTKVNLAIAESVARALSATHDAVEAEELRVKEQQIEAAEERIARLQAEVDLRKIVAPVAGTLYLHRFEVGELVKTEHVLGQVFDESTWIAKLRVPERSIPHVRPGQPVEVRLTAYRLAAAVTVPGEVMRVTRVVTPRPTGDGVFYAEVGLQAPAGVELHPGMTLWADIDTGRTRWLWRWLGG